MSVEPNPIADAFERYAVAVSSAKDEVLDDVDPPESFEEFVELVNTAWMCAFQLGAIWGLTGMEPDGSFPPDRVLSHQVKQLNYRKGYLRTRQWRAIRKMILDYYGGHCGVCGNKALDVHHARYYVGQEQFRFLIAMCRGCHDRHHARLRLVDSDDPL